MWQHVGKNYIYTCELGFPSSSAGKESACNAGDPGLIPGWGSSPEDRIDDSLQYSWASLVAQRLKESACNVGHLVSIPVLGRYTGGEHSNTLQYSCLENSHGQRSLASYSPLGCKETRLSDWAKHSTYMWVIFCIVQISWFALFKPVWL